VLDSITIINKSKEFGRESENYVINIELKSEYSILAAVLFYRFAGDSRWEMKKLIRSETNNYKSEILLQNRPLEYYINVIDKSLYHLGKMGSKSNPITVRVKKELISINSIFKVLLFGIIIGFMVLNYKL